MKFKRWVMTKQNIASIEENIYISVSWRVNETALVIYWQYYIIDWNFQKELEKLKTLEEVKKFFKDNEDKKSSRSNDEFDF